MRKLSVPGLLPLALCLSAVACGGSNAGPPARFLSIATGGTGGVYYPYGGGLAKVLNESLPGIRATAEVTAASVDNLKLIRDHKADIAFTLADTLADAIEGRGAFAGAPVPAASLAVLYGNYTHIVTRARAGIASVGDLRGKVVSTGSPGSGTEVIALRILKAAGVDPDRDLRRQGLGVSESADALKDGKIDAFFWSGGLPSPALQDLSHTPGFTLALVPSGDLVPALQQEHGVALFHARDPAGRVSRPGPGRPRRRRRQRAGRASLDGRAAGLRHHARAVREAGRARRDSPRSAQAVAADGGHRFPGRVPSGGAAVLQREGILKEKRS